MIEHEQALQDSLKVLHQKVQYEMWHFENAIWHMNNLPDKAKHYPKMHELLADMEDCSVRIAEACDAARFFIDGITGVSETTEIHVLTSEELAEKVQRRVSGKLEI